MKKKRRKVITRINQHSRKWKHLIQMVIGKKQKRDNLALNLSNSQTAQKYPLNLLHLILELKHPSIYLFQEYKTLLIHMTVV